MLRNIAAHQGTMPLLEELAGWQLQLGGGGGQAAASAWDR